MLPPSLPSGSRRLLLTRAQCSPVGLFQSRDRLRRRAAGWIVPITGNADAAAKSRRDHAQPFVLLTAEIVRYPELPNRTRAAQRGRSDDASRRSGELYLIERRPGAGSDGQVRAVPLRRPR